MVNFLSQELVYVGLRKTDINPHLNFYAGARIWNNIRHTIDSMNMFQLKSTEALNFVMLTLWFFVKIKSEEYQKAHHFATFYFCKLQCNWIYFLYIYTAHRRSEHKYFLVCPFPYLDDYLNLREVTYGTLVCRPISSSNDWISIK